MSDTTTEQTGDREMFRFLNRAWDITAARQLIENGTGEHVRLPVAGWARLLGLIAIDPARANAVDLGRPVIVAQIPDTGGPLVGPMVIDGWHRIHRAHRDGVEHLPAVLLDADAEASIRLTPTVRLTTD